MSLPDSIGVNVTLSVIKTGAHHSSSISSIKDVTSFVKAEQRIIGMPVVAGKDGVDGADGKAATVTIGTVETLPPGSNAYVRNSGTDTDAILDMGIPRGNAGEGASSWGDITGTLSDQTDLANALALKANVVDLGDLATHDTVDYQTEVTNKPTFGSLASKDSVNYATEVTNKPNLGTMASVNDAPSDSKEYVRKNGAWAESSGGGGGGITSVSWGDINGTLANQTDLQTALSSKANTSDLGDLAYEDDAPSDSKEYVRKNGVWSEATGGISSVAWGDIEGTLSDQTDLQTALDGKAPVIIDRIPVTQSGAYVVVPIGVGLVDFKATYHVTQTGTGTPSTENVRPFESTELCIVVKADSYGDIALSMETRNISLPSAIYSGIVDVLNGTVIITHGHIASYNGETLPGVWYSDRDVYASGTTPTVGAEVVYELETPIEQTCSSYTPTMFSNIDTYLWASHQSIRPSISNYTVEATFDIYEQGIVDTKTYIDQKDALKANVADLGDLAYEDDAPSDNAEYVRKNGSWAVSSGGGGGITSVAWGDVTGTLSDQTDLATALNGKQNVLNIDSTPTTGSTNPVESGGVKSYVDSHDDFKITGTVSSSGYTLTDSRINDEHWEVDWIQFLTPSNVLTGVDWSTDIVSHTVTLSATYSGSTNVVVNMHWVQ